MGKGQTKKTKLTTRERKFLKYLAEGMGKAEAAKAAGYSAKSAGPLATEVLKKPEVKSHWNQILEKQGLTDDKLGAIISEGLEATKVISCNIVAIDGEGMKDADSMTRDFVDVPDFIARHKFLDTALKLKSAYPTEKIDLTHSGTISVRVKGRDE